MAISKAVREGLGAASWIRRMFEAGARLRAERGAENVFDFSLGNPDLQPPQAFVDRLREVAADERPGVHKYMPNVGLEETRRAVAGHLAQETGVPFEAAQIVMSVGAAGGINLAMNVLLDPGDEVITLTPYFVEYGFYVRNFQALNVEVDTDEAFLPDIERLAAAITERTKLVIINFPNNPTGRVCPEDRLQALADCLAEAERRHGHPIYLLSDEPYRNICFDDVVLPSPAAAYRNTLTVTSHSKDLSLPGERIGCLAVNPEADDAEEIVRGAAFCSRTLGYVNAPALMQRVVATLQGVTVDVGVYQRRRDLLSAGLARIGYDFVMPEGAFYLFPKAPGGDDLAFTSLLVEQGVLCVPGRGFRRAGYFRISYAAPDDVIRRSLPAFERAFQAAEAQSS